MALAMAVGKRIEDALAVIMALAIAAGRRIVDTLAKSVYDNPIVTREFRTRMRGKRAFIIMGGYVLFLGVVLSIAFFTQIETRQGTLANSKVGLLLFESLTWTQAILLALVVPALTSGSLTHELEHKTIEMLALTRITAGKTILGKQLSGFVYALVLLACSVPLAGMCLMFGGISPAEIAVTYALLAAWAFLFTCAGVFFSSLFNRTAAATLVCYAFCLGYTFFSFVYGADPSIQIYQDLLSLLNPGHASIAALAVAHVYGMSIPIAIGPFVLHVCFGILMLLVASTHVRHLRAERALPIRLMILFITAAIIWLLAGGSVAVIPPAPGGAAVGPATPTGPSPLTSHISMDDQLPMLVFLLAGAAIFATGAIGKRRDRSVFARALSALKVFSSDLRGGIGFMALWAVFTYLVFGGCILWVEKAGGGLLTRQFWETYICLSVSAVTMVVGISAVGVLASSLLASRRTATVLVLVLIAILFAGYAIVGAYYSPRVSDDHNPVWQLAGLWPLTPFYAATVVTADWKSNWPPLAWAREDSWLAVTVVYLVIGALALAIANPAFRRFGGVRED